MNTYATYAIESDGKSCFQVKVTGSGGEQGGGHIMTGFTSPGAAQSWIDDHKASVAAADRRNWLRAVIAATHYWGFRIASVKPVPPVTKDKP